MLALGLVLNTIGVGSFCWLIFTLAVDALPFFMSVNAGMIAFRGGAGVIDAPLADIAAGAATLAVWQTAFAIARSPLLARGNCGHIRHPGGYCRLSHRFRLVADRSILAGLA